MILTSIGWTLLLWFVGRPVLKYLSRKTRSGGEGGPSQTMTAFTLFLVLTSAWLTDRIGVHAIFGAFLVGLVVPKEIRGPLTEKIEDLVTILFLPLYFALSCVCCLPLPLRWTNSADQADAVVRAAV